MPEPALTCAACDATGPDVFRRPQNTQYENEDSNWCVLCAACQAQADEYWAERWAEYYAGLL